MGSTRYQLVTQAQPEPINEVASEYIERSHVDFRGHDLRRTAASLMVGAGVPRRVVSKILNHVETGVTAVYDRHITTSRSVRHSTSGGSASRQSWRTRRGQTSCDSRHVAEKGSSQTHQAEES
jgi:hypothetical protein